MDRSVNYLIPYIAGLWEGEGSVSHHKNRATVHEVRISQAMVKSDRTSDLPLKMCKTLFGGDVYYYTRDYKGEDYPYVVWVMSKRAEVVHFLQSILPYCLMRQREIVKVLQFYNNHPVEKQEQLWNET